MSERVSVDAAALQDFIKSARSDNEGLISEFCVGEGERQAQRASFDEGVARLDIQPQPVSERSKNTTEGGQ
jgi:hypothetical protein